MIRIYSFLALVLVSAAAAAGPTNIAQVPLLNITGTGAVKPNLMLLYDNSGSMASAFTPDYVDDSTTCRARSTMAGGTRACQAGHPPFHAADFNRQYYNPKVLYSPPVKSDGTSYPSLNSSNTTGWTRVTTDGFGVNDKDLLGNGVSTTNLVTGFPDLKWCDTSNSNCVFNTVTYSYPNDTRYTPVNFSANPYYYTINVAEYCTDATLTNCTSTSLGAPAPAGYPVPARVRWCNSTSLTNCQAKYVGSYKYPRFGDPNRSPDWYGTITIQRSAYANPLTISSVSVASPSGTFVITNGAVTASAGTNTATTQAATAVLLAQSIIARTGLAEQYTACVRTPGTSGVPACSTYGITLATDNVVGVVPVDCPTGSSSKAVGPCTLASDGSRAGRDLIVTSGTSATALLTVKGTSNSSKNEVLSGVSLGGTQLFSSSLSLTKNANAASVASQIAAKIGTVGSIRAVVGGTAGTSSICQNASTSTVCLIDTSVDADGKNIALGSLSNNGNKPPLLTFTTTAAVTDGVPTDTTPLGGSVFVRTDVVPTRTSYPKDSARTDCAGSTCTYDEEMTNFANWYGYYKTRNQMMKTAVGQAFRPLTDNYNIGIVSLSVAAAQGAMTPPKRFSGADRNSWYTRLYAMDGSNSTPIRPALHSIGKMFANQSPYVATPGEEVVAFPCQQNFTFVTTDGYWNGNAALNVTSNDQVESASRFCLRSSGCVDPSSQTANSLADVALYWYNGGSNSGVSSLRPNLEDWSRPGLVPAASGENTRLHMNTYALGLGVDGIMAFEPNYDTAPQAGGDFYKLITGVTAGCPWNNNGAYVWPDPKTGDDGGSAAYQSRVDDLWHAAINGHGKYFSASDPHQVVSGLQSALSNIEVKIGAAAAAATSTPNISQQDNDIFSATFTTVKWFGELSDRKIDPVTGVVGKDIVWNSSDQLGRKVRASDDDRTIYMLDVEAGSPALKLFQYPNLNSTEKSWFDNKCSALSQCDKLSASDQAIVNNGANIIGWLRGQQQYADDTVLRAYARTDHNPAGMSAPLPIVLGDIASSKPAYMREPRKGYTDPKYIEFKENHADRAATVFAAANDGMLHAFDADSGQELWAYAPRLTMKKMHLLASKNYGTNHMFTVDGSPELADVKFSDGNFRTVLVAGLNGGGRGYYAVDVTDPATPKALWELCADPAICTGENNEPELGLTFGNPQFGTWVDGSGNERWVVFLTSGYNNVPGTDGVAGGSGKGYLFVIDVETGAVLKRLTTNSGTTTTPSGLAKITAITNNPNSDPRVTYVYGGDNLGQMWRFDFVTPLDSPLKMGDAGPQQPITTRPDVALCEVSAALSADGTPGARTTRVVAFGTGRLLDVPDVSNTDLQSAYVLKDGGTAIAPIDWRAASKMAKMSLAKASSSAGDIYTVSGAGADLSTQFGWYMDFDQNAGERVNLDPKIVAGGLNIVTNLPSSSSACSLGGTSNVYQLNVCTGRSVEDSSGTNQNAVAGHTLSNTAAAVGFIIVRLPSGALKMITTTADGNTITSGVTPANSDPTHRAGWRRVRD